MTRPGEPYSRIYWSVIDDYPDVYEDDATFSLWVRMLLNADAAYPMRPICPKQTKVLGRLVDAGLVIVERGRYTVRGLSQERDRRSERGRAGGVASGYARRPANAEQLLNVRSEQDLNEMNLDKTRQDKTRQEDSTSVSQAKPPPQLPQTMMGFRPKAPIEPGIWGGTSTHDGRHGDRCTVCVPVTPAREQKP